MTDETRATDWNELFEGEEREFTHDEKEAASYFDSWPLGRYHPQFVVLEDSEWTKSGGEWFPSDDCPSGVQELSYKFASEVADGRWEEAKRLHNGIKEWQ